MTLAEYLFQQRVLDQSRARRGAVRSALFAFLVTVLAAACILVGKQICLEHSSALVWGIALAVFGPPAVVLTVSSFFAVEETVVRWRRAQGKNPNPFHRPCPKCSHNAVDTLLCVGKDFRLHVPACEQGYRTQGYLHASSWDSWLGEEVKKEDFDR